MPNGRLTPIDRSKELLPLQKAEKLGFSRFEGTHHDACCFCDDGGNLLCCELCDNTQHHACCDPPIQDSSDLEYWICDSCINDIRQSSDAPVGTAGIASARVTRSGIRPRERA